MYMYMYMFNINNLKKNKKKRFLDMLALNISHVLLSYALYITTTQTKFILSMKLYEIQCTAIL